MKRAFQMWLIIGIVLSLSGVRTLPVLAGDTCRWEGDVDPSWHEKNNWSCGKVPTYLDTVLIDTATPYDPVIDPYTAWTVYADQIYIGEINTLTTHTDLSVNVMTIDGVLNLSATEHWIVINSQVKDYAINNFGVINCSVTGSLENYIGYDQVGTFHNHGTVDIKSGKLTLQKASGTHDGVFKGNNFSILQSGSHYFDKDSEVSVNEFYVGTNVTAIVAGTLTPVGTEKKLGVYGNTTVKTGAVINPIGKLLVFNGGKMIFEDETYPNIQSLNVDGELQNGGHISVESIFTWGGAGKLSGSGSTTIELSALFNLSQTGTRTLEAQTLVNSTEANWNDGSINLTNGAVFQNDVMLNANAATTISGSAGEAFVNHGYLHKYTEGTTTTFNIPFTNHGNVKIFAGALAFLQGIENGDDATLDLGGGSLDAGENLVLESGDSLVGSGTLGSNLQNGGLVSPGNTPGCITVNGDYSQTEAGELQIELGGLVAGSEFDQLVVTGSASLAGILNVSLINSFVPVAGESFVIMIYDSASGEFTSKNLPELAGGLTWNLQYTETELILSVESGSNIQIFLPVILR